MPRHRPKDRTPGRAEGYCSRLRITAESLVESLMLPVIQGIVGSRAERSASAVRQRLGHWLLPAATLPGPTPHIRPSQSGPPPHIRSPSRENTRPEQPRHRRQSPSKPPPRPPPPPAPPSYRIFF